MGQDNLEKNFFEIGVNRRIQESVSDLELRQRDFTGQTPPDLVDDSLAGQVDNLADNSLKKGAFCGKIKGEAQECTTTFALLTKSNFCIGEIRMAKSSLPNTVSTNKICSVDGCDKRLIARGLCNKHYQRLKFNGNPLISKKNRGEGETVEQRFWTRAIITADTTKCWLWQGCTDDSGYGMAQVVLDGTKWSKAHRLAYFLYYGVNPEDAKVLHSCDNPLCINPHHLSLGTQADNMADMMRKGRRHSSAGELNPRAKLTYAQAETIRASSEKNVVLAQQYGVTTALVGKIKRGEVWKQNE